MSVMPLVIRRYDDEGRLYLPLSFAQQRLWFVHQLAPSSPFYNMSFTLRIRGHLRTDVLQRVVDQIVERHEILRSFFDSRQGVPLQVIAPTAAVPIRTIDLSSLSELAEQEVTRLVAEFSRVPFDLTHCPLLRLRLFRLSDQDYVFAVVMHHIIADGWSLGVFTREFSLLYNAFTMDSSSPLPLLPIQYADFTIWQRDWMLGDEAKRQLNFWRNRLWQPPPELRLLTDRSRITSATYQGSTFRFDLRADLAGELMLQVQKSGTTPFMFLLAVFQILLSRYCDQSDFLLGTVIANRNRPDLESLIGFFVNTLVVRSDTEEGLTFADVLLRVRDSALSAQENQDYPFEALVADQCSQRDIVRNPFFDVLFVMENAPLPALVLNDLEVTVKQIRNDSAKFDLTLFVTQRNDQFECEWEFSSELFENSTIERMSQHFQNLVREVSANPHKLISHYQFADESEQRRIIVDWNKTSLTRPAECVDSVIQRQSRVTPQAPALIFGAQRMNYDELDSRAEQLARKLRLLGAKSDDLVGIYLEPSFELIIAILGVMKSGAAYVPLDPTYPACYLTHILNDASPKIVVTKDSLANQLPTSESALLRIDELNVPDILSECDRGIRSNHDLVYVIYTSGSTGRPKGVMVEHAALANVSSWIAEELQINDKDRCLFKTPLNFDAAAREIFPTLMAGGCIVIAEPGGYRDVNYLARMLQRHEITLFHCVPSLLAGLVDEPDFKQANRLRAVMCGGEPLQSELAKQFVRRSGARLYNVYGPTEATVDSTYYPVEEDVCSSIVPLGRPISNTHIYILDGQLQPVPVGVSGEIFIGGSGVARGYWKNEELTKQRFVSSALDGHSRLYATGDRGRYRSDGVIEFLGRCDDQVKVAGVRIELSEVEQALMEHPHVREAAASIKPDSLGNNRIVAYVTCTKLPSDTRSLQNNSLASGVVADWNSVFDRTYFKPREGGSLDFNTVGWESSYTLKPFTAAEMHEWIDATISQLMALPHASILEIGCGTGLLLFRLAEACDSYVGTDFSTVALDYVRQHAPGNVTLKALRADQIEQLPESTKFDLIVMNSVVQYFPNETYLRDVLDKAIQLLGPDGVIFIGDVRDLRLQQVFHESVQFSRCSDHVTAGECRRRASDRVWREEELLINPAFFSNWAQAQTRPIHVETSIKSGSHNNELNKFRYDVTIRFITTQKSSPFRQIKYSQSIHSRDWLVRYIQDSRETTLVVRDIPNVRIAEDAYLHQLLNQTESLHLTCAELRTLVAKEVAPALDPQDLVASLRDGLGLHVRLVVSRNPNCFDLVFDASQDLCQIQDWGPVDPAIGYCNDPLRRRRLERLTPELSQHLTLRLPRQMIPDRFVLISEMPRLPNGKLDRAALPSPESRRPQLEELYVEPSSLMEQYIHRVWREVLNVDRVGVNDNFFQIGGHSLLATQIVSRLSESIAPQIALRDVFDYPTISSLAGRLSAREPIRKQSAAKEIIPIDRSVRLPLSFAQNRLWFIDQMYPGNSVYTIAHGARVRGDFSVEGFRQAVESVVARQESLRTRFPIVNGQAWQLIDPPGPVDVPMIDLAHLEKEMAESAAHDEWERLLCEPFDLACGPLLRCLVIRFSQQDHIVLVAMHHIISDGWSMGILLREVSEFYNSLVLKKPPQLPELKLQYADYAAWQREQLSGKNWDELLNYWRNQLGESPPVLKLPLDFPRPNQHATRGKTIRFTISQEKTNLLREIGQKQQATLFMTLLTVYEALLHRMSGQSDFVIGTVIANRNLLAIEPLVGFFVNAIALRADLTGSPCFRTLLERVKTTVLDASQHQDMPFERLVESLSVDRNRNYQAVFQVLFVMQNAPSAELNLVGSDSERLQWHKTGAMFDLSLEFRETNAGLSGALEYNEEIFEHRTAERFIQRFVGLLDLMCEQSNIPIAELDLCSKQDIAEFVHISEGPTANYGEFTRLDNLLETAMRQSGDRLALVFPTDQDRSHELSYSTLYKQADLLAMRLRGMLRSQEPVIGVFLPRSPLVVVSLLGILKAGAAFLYCDPKYPSQRWQFMLSDVGADVILTNTELCSQLGPTEREVLLVDELLASFGDDLSQVEADSYWQDYGEAEPNRLAYVTYTSGSTSQPKAVLITRGALADRILANQQVLPPLIQSDRMLHCYSFNYDGGIISLFWPLVAGATIIFQPLEELGDSRQLLKRVESYGITVLDTIPAVVQGLLEEPEISVCSNLRHVITGGEACPVDLPRIVLDKLDVHFSNQYGPAEATVNSTSWTTNRSTWNGVVSIGRPLPHTRVYVLDQLARPCPIGIPGELYIGGSCLARGYHNEPAEMAKRFLDDPLRPGKVIYRSGDLGRYRNDGLLEFHGRVDRQIQIRGMRVELEEIEATFTQHPNVGQAIVDVFSQGNSEPRLVAYIVPAVPLAGGEEEKKLDQRRLDEWQELFDTMFSSHVQPIDPTMDFVGWDSSFNGHALPLDEMQEWLSNTSNRIRELSPNHVLEIGCGIGLLIFQLAEECASYTGVDIAKPALDQARFVSEQRGLRNLRLEQCSADKIESLGQTFDTIILNSVIQYFPSRQFLSEVLHSAWRMLRPGGHLFIGDVRNNCLQKAFHTAVQLQQVGPETSLSHLHRRVSQRASGDSELVVDPRFFASIREQLADLGNVNVLLKRGRKRNELVDFRYDVILSRAPIAQSSVKSINELYWTGKWSLTDLRFYLQEKRPTSFSLLAVPDARVVYALKAAELLSDVKHRQKSTKWLNELLKSHVASAWDPEDVWNCVEELGYFANLTPSVLGPAGTFDLQLFNRMERGSSPIFGYHAQTEFSFRETSDPLNLGKQRQLRADLREFIKSRLPQHAVPAEIVIVNQLPVSSGGKIDFDELALQRSDECDTAFAGTPLSLTEAVVCDIWSELLRREITSIHADFFELGGHSLLASKVISQLRAFFKVDIPLRMLYEATSVSRLAAAIDEWTGRVPDKCAGQNSIVPRCDDIPSLSYFQQSLFQEASEVKTTHFGFALRIAGAFRPEVFKEAVRLVVAHHDSLRLRFDDTEPAGVLYGTDAKYSPVVVEALPLDRNRSDVIEQLLQRPLNLAQGGPFEIQLLQASPENWSLIFRLHPIVFDGWSVRILLSEIANCYSTALEGSQNSLKPLSWQFADFACSQQERAAKGGFDVALQTWERRLAALHQGDVTKVFGGSDVYRTEFIISPELVAALRHVASCERVTVFTVFLASFAGALGEFYGDSRVLLCTSSSNRRIDGAEYVIGPFANEIPLYFDLFGVSAKDRIAAAHAAMLEAISNDEVPFEYLCSHLDCTTGRSLKRMVRAALVLNETRVQEIDLPGLIVSREEIDLPGPLRYDVRLSLFSDGEEFRGRFSLRQTSSEDSYGKAIIAIFGRLLREVGQMGDVNFQQEPFTFISKSNSYERGS
jgi:amino acid adenylation domain-containing protein